MLLLDYKQPHFQATLKDKYFAMHKVFDVCVMYVLLELS